MRKDPLGIPIVKDRVVQKAISLRMNLSEAIFKNTKYLLLGIWSYGESIWNYENIFTGWTQIFIYQIM